MVESQRYATTGISRATIAREGARERNLSARDRARRKGAGRKIVERLDPGIRVSLEALLSESTAGDSIEVERQVTLKEGPLRTSRRVLNLIIGIQTKTDVKVDARLDTNEYQRGITVAKSVLWAGSQYLTLP